MIVSWPEVIKQNSKSEHVSAFWDVVPTVCEIIGEEAPGNIDGLSFLPELINDKKAQKQHEYLYWEFHELGGRQALLMGDWKAVRYNVFDTENSTIELYNLSEDIGETNNVSQEHPEIIKKVETLFQKARIPSETFSFQP